MRYGRDLGSIDPCLVWEVGQMPVLGRPCRTEPSRYRCRIPRGPRQTRAGSPRTALTRPSAPLTDLGTGIYARRASMRVVIPMGSRTTGGDPVVQKITAVRLACAPGRVSDGGYRVEITATNGRTGQALGKAQSGARRQPQGESRLKIGP